LPNTVYFNLIGCYLQNMIYMYILLSFGQSLTHKSVWLRIYCDALVWQTIYQQQVFQSTWSNTLCIMWCNSQENINTRFEDSIRYWKICLQTLQHCFLSAFYFCFDLLYWICIAKLLVLLLQALVFTPTEGRWHVHNNPLIWSVKSKTICMCVKHGKNFSVCWLDKATFHDFVDKDKELYFVMKTWVTKATHEVTY